MVEWNILGNLCEIGTGSNNREDACDNGLYPFFVRSKEVLRIDSYLYDEEAVLIPGEGGVGDIFHYINGKYGLHQRTYRVHPISTKVSGRYLFYYLSGNFKSYINSKSYKATAASIRKPMLIDFPIALPVVEEQKRIVDILDTFTASIYNLKQQIVQRRKQYEYYRDQLLNLEGKEGVEMKTIKDVCRKICSGGTPSTSKHEYYGGSIPWLRTQEVDWKEIYDTEIKITEEAIAHSSAKIIPANCVIVAMYGATAAKVAINKIPVSTNQACCNLEIDPQKALYKYVFHWLCKEYQNLKAMGEGSQNNINGQKVKDYPIPVPPLSEQQRIVDILDKFEASIQNLEAQFSQREKQYEYYRNKLLAFE